METNSRKLLFEVPTGHIVSGGSELVQTAEGPRMKIVSRAEETLETLP